MPPLSGHQFEHLPLVLRDRRPTRVPPVPVPPNPTTVLNATNRIAHSSGLRTHTSNVSSVWKAAQETRLQDGLPPTEAGIPPHVRVGC